MQVSEILSPLAWIPTFVGMTKVDSAFLTLFHSLAWIPACAGMTGTQARTAAFQLMTAGAWHRSCLISGLFP
jgi:hypothetical protein